MASHRQPRGTEEDHGCGEALQYFFNFGKMTKNKMTYYVESRSREGVRGAAVNQSVMDSPLFENKHFLAPKRMTGCIEKPIHPISNIPRTDNRVRCSVR